jgi:asparagine synthetase B (glutamine-hydrolysing)
LPSTTGARPTSTRESRIDRLLRWDFANYLPEYVLRKADLATMAHGLELRAPLLDHRFVEAVLALPAQTATRGRRSCSSRASRRSWSSMARSRARSAASIRRCTAG